MSLSLRHLFSWGLLASLGVFLLAGCGTDEYDPSPARGGEPAPVADDRAAKDLSDTSIRSIELSTSSEYLAETDEVRLFALVRDQASRFLNDLNAYNFGIRIDTHRFVDVDEVDLTTTLSDDNLVALVLDTSGSMGSAVDPSFPVSAGGDSRMAVAREAARSFVDLMNVGDRTAIVEFATDARTVQQLTDDQALLHTAINKLTPTTLTNIGGALTEAVRAVGSRPGKRAVILLTDGDDTVDTVQGGPATWLNNSESTRYQGLQLALENNLIVYTVGLGDGLPEGGGIGTVGVADLQTIAERTGGSYFPAPDAASLLTAFTTTIPREVNALPPMETYQLTFANPVPAGFGEPLDISYLLTVKYENAVDIHRSVFGGTYTIR